jgi:hypothetical protein
MKFANKKDPETGKSVNDKTTVIYNDFITLKNIPSAPTTTSSTASPPSNGSWNANPSPPTKTAASPTTPTSGPPKPWATPRYPLEIFLRVVTVSLETNRIVAALPGIFYELSQMEVIQKRPIEDYRLVKKAERHDFSIKEASEDKELKIRYNVDFASLTTIDSKKLHSWLKAYNNNKRRHPHPLDYLYEIAPHKELLKEG